MASSTKHVLARSRPYLQATLLTASLASICFGLVRMTELNSKWAETGHNHGSTRMDILKSIINGRVAHKQHPHHTRDTLFYTLAIPISSLIIGIVDAVVSRSCTWISLVSAIAFLQLWCSQTAAVMLCEGIGHVRVPHSCPTYSPIPDEFATTYLTRVPQLAMLSLSYLMAVVASLYLVCGAVIVHRLRLARRGAKKDERNFTAKHAEVDQAWNYVSIR